MYFKQSPRKYPSAACHSRGSISNVMIVQSIPYPHNSNSLFFSMIYQPHSLRFQVRNPRYSLTNSQVSSVSWLYTICVLNNLNLFWIFIPFFPVLFHIFHTLKVGTESCSKDDELSSLVGVSRSKGRCNEDFEVLLLVGCFTDQLITWNCVR